MFYLLPANKRRAWPTPHKATGDPTRRNSLPSLVLHLEEKLGKKDKLSIMCSAIASYHLSGSCTLFGEQTSNTPKGERSGCASICALKVRIDKHLQSRKRRRSANGSQAVNLNQGVFFTHFTTGAIHFFCLCR